MNPIETFLEQHTYIRSRLIGLLKEIEDSGKAEEALYWKLPYGEKGRAHIHWQVLHCAATLDRYLNVRVLKQNPKNEKLVAGFAGGSVPDPENRIPLNSVREILSETFEDYCAFFRKLDPVKLSEKPHPDADRPFKDVLLLLNWHEAEHTGQCQIIWNCFKNRL